MFLTSSFLPIPSHDGHPTTTASADFSQFVVTTANETVRETSRDKPASLSSSTCLIYIHGLRLPFGLCCPKPAHPPCTPCIRFLSVKLRFRYPFFSPIPHDINLGSRLEFVGNYAPCGLSPQTDGMSVILRNVRRQAHTTQKIAEPL